MPQLRLTEISVRAIKSADNQITYFDTITPNFGVRVGKSTRTFVAMKGKTRERVTIGRWPDVSVGDARAEAKRILAADQRPEIASMAFSEARTAFLERYSNPCTAYQVTRVLECHFKALETTLLSDITHEDIERCLFKLADRPSERLHAFRYLRTLFNWSAKAPRKWVKVSPMQGYDPPGTDRKGTRILTDTELAAVWHASPPIFRILILWGTRNSETCFIEREWEVDGVITIPGQYTKNGRDHAVPVCPIARHVLNSTTGNQYVFAGRWGGHISPGALGKMKCAVVKQSGVKGWQLRDLRRTFRSNMARIGVTRDVCEVLINHAPPVLDEIYDKYDRLKEKREALFRYEQGLVWLLAQGST